MFFCKNCKTLKKFKQSSNFKISLKLNQVDPINLKTNQNFYNKKTQKCFTCNIS
jgi:hypothetical protein